MITNSLDAAVAAQLADRIAVIAAGVIVATGTPATLGDRRRSGVEISFALPPGVSADDLPAALAARAAPDGRDRVTLASATVAADLHRLSGWALARGLEHLEVRRPTLEDVYLKLTTDPQPRS
jgi:ABC-2 type transport system ATP-binding protein